MPNTASVTVGLTGPNPYFCKTDSMKNSNRPQMNTSANNPDLLRNLFFPLRAIATKASALFAIAVLAIIQTVNGQSTVADDFDSGNDAAWTGYDGGGATDVPPTPARETSFPNDPACGGKNYRILLNGSQSA